MREAGTSRKEKEEPEDPSKWNLIRVSASQQIVRTKAVWDRLQSCGYETSKQTFLQHSSSHIKLKTVICALYAYFVGGFSFLLSSLLE